MILIRRRRDVTILGQPFNGDIVTIGGDGWQDASTISAGTSGLRPNTLILIYPGSYASQTFNPTFDDDEKVSYFVKGMGRSYDDVYIAGGTSSNQAVVAAHGYNCVIENLKINVSYAWKSALASYMIAADHNGRGGTHYYNRLHIDGSTQNYQWLANAVPYGRLIMSYCFVGKGYAHFTNANSGNNTTIIMHRCRSNAAWAVYQTTGVTWDRDLVTTATEGYGPDYANDHLIQINDPMLMAA